MMNKGYWKTGCRQFLLFTFAFLLLPGDLFGLRLFAQETKPEQVLKLKSELVNVRAVVTDKNGVVVDNLRKEDFEVLENNRPQEISFFSRERIGGPSRTATPERAVEDPASPRTTSATTTSGIASRTVVLYVDTVNLSFSSLPLLKQELKKYVASSLAENDQIALVTTTASLGIFEQFTRDRQMLNRAIDRLTPWQPETRLQLFTPYLASRVLSQDKTAKQIALCILQEEMGQPCRSDAASNPLTSRMNPGDENRVDARARDVMVQAIQRRQMTLSTLKSVTERLQKLPGQKILALFSDGFSLMGATGQPELSEVRTVATRAIRSGVMIYSFHTKGLQTETVADASLGIFMPPPAFSTYMSFASRDYENGINALAADTGGKALFNTNNLTLGLQKALDDNSTYYALDYYSPNDDAENKFREIKVRVKNHADYRVRAQRGYLPADLKSTEMPTMTAQQRLIQAMTSPMPVTTLGVVAMASFLELEGDNAQVSLLVSADANTFDYLMQNDNRLFDAEIAIAVLDSSGKLVKTINEQMKGTLTPEQFELARRNGFKYSKRLDLGPGFYNIRVGLMETRTERVGTAIIWTEVPDLRKGRLALSDLLLISMQPRQSNQPDVLQRVSRHGEPIFQSVDILSCVFKIYNSPGEANLQMRVEFLQNGQQVLQTQWAPVRSFMDDRDSKGINVSQQFRLNNLKPGLYDLKVSVQDPTKKQSAEAQRRFVIEP